MNRARRTAANKKPLAKRSTDEYNQDDDFESDAGSDGEGDFSASEDEWLPEKNKKAGSTDHMSESDERSEDECGENPSEESGSDESVVAKKGAKAKRKLQSSPKQQQKKKRLSPGTRDELYKRTKKHLLKESELERPPLNSSVADILKQCQFRKKLDISQMVKSKEVFRKKTVGNDDDSDSSGDDHLIDPEKLDLNSKFFDQVERTAEDVPTPQFDCNAGMRLSDSSDDDQAAEHVPASIPKIAAHELVSKINESSSGFMNFNNLGEFTKKLEEAKQMLKNYQAKSVAAGSQASSKDDNISNLLALGETDVSNPLEMATEFDNEEKGSEDSDWEEVEDDVKKSQASQKIVQDYNIMVEVETNKSKKKRWEEIEMELFIKRQINKIKRDNQLAFHKSSILCAIAAGRKLNAILNSDQIQAMTLSLMQSKQCQPKGQPEVKFVETLMKWFKDVFVLKSQQVFAPETFNVKFTIALELFTRKVICKRDYVLIFLACLRTVGIPSRLVTSAWAPPKRPAMKDLCPISERQLIEKFEQEYRKKGHQSEESSYDTTPDKNAYMKEEKHEPLINDIKEEVVASSTSACKIKGTQAEEKCLKPDDGLNQVNQKVPSAKPSKKNTKKISESVETISNSPQNLKAVKSKSQTANGSEAKATKTTIASRLRLALDDKPIVSKSRKKTAEKPKESSPRKSTRFSVTPERNGEQLKSTTATPSPKENSNPRRGVRNRSQPREIRENGSPRKALYSLNIPQLDGVNDLNLTPKSVPRLRTLRSRTKTTSTMAVADSNVGSPFDKRKHNTPKEQNNNQPGKILKRKLFKANELVEVIKPAKVTSRNKTKSLKNKILAACSSSESEDESTQLEPSQSSPALNAKRRFKSRNKPKPASQPDSDSVDSDFEPPGGKKSKTSAASKAKLDSPAKKKTATSKKSAKQTKGKDTEAEGSTSAATGKIDLWIEIYSKKDKRWISIDLFSGKTDCVDYLMRHATAPISYVFGFDNDNHVKDITPRYVQHWNTVCRKLRVEPKWVEKALKPFVADKTERDKLEDMELNKIHIDKPLPTTIAECKNHPLYVLKRHLLKFEALYPPDVPSLGFVRGEAIYARECLFILQTREKWYKQGRVVKPFETAYKVVKCWKYDKFKNEWLKNQPCDIFGVWQTEEYDPPTAENGMVPRNEYGNVELFTPKMLPKKTVHLQLPGLNKVCRRLGIDCAPALTGFDKARMRMIPVYDGFVVCEEYANQVVEEWYKEMEEEERKEQEKYEKRVYGNWKRLIKGLLVRRKLQNKYNFDNL